MEADAKVIAAWVGVIGVVLAALMSSAGYLFRNRTERKKSARKVLYLLLEIRHSIIASLFDPDEATEKYFVHYMARLNTKGIVANPEDLTDSLRAMVSGHFYNMTSSLKTDIETRLLNPFEEALFEMASVNPVLAYQLRGKEKLEKLVAHTNQYQSKVTEQVEVGIVEEWAREVMLELSNELKEEALNELSETLNNDVLTLAKACGWLDHRKCKAVLDKAASNKNKYDFEDLDKSVDKLVEKLVLAANMQTQGA